MREIDIRKTALMAGLSAQDQQALAAVGRRVSFLPGEAVFSGTLRADTLFVLGSGAIDVSRRDADGTDHFVLTLEPGAVFGEAGLLDGYPRQAHGNARGTVVCWCLDGEGLTRLSVDHPGTATRLLANLARGMARRLERAAAKVNALADPDGQGPSARAIAGVRRTLWDRLRGR